MFKIYNLIKTLLCRRGWPDFVVREKESNCQMCDLLKWNRNWNMNEVEINYPLKISFWNQTGFHFIGNLFEGKYFSRTARSCRKSTNFFKRFPTFPYMLLLLWKISFGFKTENIVCPRKMTGSNRNTFRRFRKLSEHVLWRTSKYEIC